MLGCRAASAWLSPPAQRAALRKFGAHHAAQNAAPGNGNHGNRCGVLLNAKARPRYPARSYSSSRYREKKEEWKVPSGLYIPEEQLELSFVRSSGAGGQNVNKVNTQVQLKLDLNNAHQIATWIPDEVQQRLKQQQRHRINKRNELTLQVQQHRTQTQNRKAAVDKLRELILQAWPRPVVRKERKGISKEAKERNKQDKRHKSAVKASRRRVEY